MEEWSLLFCRMCSLLQSLRYLPGACHIPGAMVDNGNNLPCLRRMNKQTSKSSYHHNHHGLAAPWSVIHATPYFQPSKYQMRRLHPISQLSAENVNCSVAEAQYLWRTCCPSPGVPWAGAVDLKQASKSQDTFTCNSNQLMMSKPRTSPPPKRGMASWYWSRFP